MEENQFVSSKTLETQAYVVKNCARTMCGSTDIRDGDSRGRLVQR